MNQAWDFGFLGWLIWKTRNGYPQVKIWNSHNPWFYWSNNLILHPRLHIEGLIYACSGFAQTEYFWSTPRTKAITLNP